ncbi:hypothetical protein MKX07_000214 [Trichoderma sp. CBMAI-0711]|nr:hypothetical protein MKX07_000214 [Trichoderma sp. CBMAI-0711]
MEQTPNTVLAQPACVEIHSKQRRTGLAAVATETLLACYSLTPIIVIVTVVNKRGAKPGLLGRVTRTAAS